MHSTRDHAYAGNLRFVKKKKIMNFDVNYQPNSDSVIAPRAERDLRELNPLKPRVFQKILFLFTSIVFVIKYFGFDPSPLRVKCSTPISFRRMCLEGVSQEFHNTARGKKNGKFGVLYG